MSIKDKELLLSKMKEEISDIKVVPKRYRYWFSYELKLKDDGRHIDREGCVGTVEEIPIKFNEIVEKYGAPEYGPLIAVHILQAWPSGKYVKEVRCFRYDDENSWEYNKIRY